MTLSNYYGELAAIAGAICFGVGNVIIKSQGKKINPIAINAIRLSFSAVFYLILVLSLGTLKETFSYNAKTGLLLVGGSLLGVVIGDVIFYFSQQLIGLSKAYPIAVSYPLVTYLLGIAFHFETYDFFKIQGVLLVVLGVYLVSTSTEDQSILTIRQPAPTVEITTRKERTKEEEEIIAKKISEIALEKKKAKQKIILGILLATTTAFCWAIGTIMMDQGLKNNVSGISANAYRIALITPASVLIFLAGNRGKLKTKFNWKSILLVLIAGVIGNTIGSLLYVFALSFTEASTTAAISAAAPLIATPLSILFLKERVSFRLILGTLLTTTGIWLIIS